MKQKNANFYRQILQYIRTNPRNSILIVLLIIFGYFGINDLEDTSVQNNQTEISTPVAFDGSNYNVLPKEQKIPAEFVSARDGDTIVVSVNGHEINVRYLIIDTPEMNYDTGNPDPYAEEALEANLDYLTQADQIYLEFDVGPFTDNYNRALAYVYADDIFVNEALVADGLATVRYLNPPNVSKEPELRKAESQAQKKQINIWK
ncbi:thermonuclease family protein [Fundicoccus sp. Sow4_H7]|uniref:thermonuclease family protein n=1 Tax=Fundicoccus sp. Sow4_H7 TaxID=3438784 RepID=UPI003F92D599